MFVRWADDAQNESTGLGIFTTTSYPVFPEYRKRPGASWSANVVSVVSPTMTNEFIFAYNHLTQVVDVVPGTDTSIYDRDKLGFTLKELCNPIFPGAPFCSGFFANMSPPVLIGVYLRRSGAPGKAWLI